MKWILIAAFLFMNMRILFAQVVAPFCTGIDADGTDDDWLTCSAEPMKMDLRQSGSDNPQTLQNALRVRFAHDNSHIYVLAKVDAAYHFQLGFADENELAHAFSVMWRIGERATMKDMGGCPIPGLEDDPTNCTAAELICDANDGKKCECSDYLTDLWFAKHAAQGIIPGVQYPLRIPIITRDQNGTHRNYAYNVTYQASIERLYSGNDPTGNIDEEYAAHICLRNEDGAKDARAPRFKQFVLPGIQYRNQLRYAWSHTALESREYPFGTIGANGTYTYEISRPLRTRENTDVQFNVGKDAYFAFAFWIPTAENTPHAPADHYVAPVPFKFGTVTLSGAERVIYSATLCLVAVFTAAFGRIF